MPTTSAVRQQGTTGARPVPAAAPERLRDVLTGPVRVGRVVGGFRSAVYVETGGLPRVAAVVSRGAVRLPVAMVVPDDDVLTALGSPLPGEAVRVGGGGLVVGRATVYPARWWRPRRPRPPVDTRAVAAAATSMQRLLDAGPLQLEPSVATAAGRLARALHSGEPAAAARAAGRLTGLGRGLTPAGDDVLAGALLALRHLSQAFADAQRWQRVAAALADRIRADAPSRTTAVSAGLLDAAVDGEAADAVVEVLEAMAGHVALEPAVTALLTVGHSSGHDLARGLLLATRTLLGHPPWPVAATGEENP